MIVFKNIMSKLYSLSTVQKIPTSLDVLWDFVSSPQNLKLITPPEMGFDITIDTPVDKMYAGLIIAYNVSPVLGIKLNWVTEISQVVDKQYFVDEQRFGPYSFWHHKHFLKEIDGGVEMTDIVHYKLPLGFLGDIANTLFVKNQLKKIFDFRTVAMDKAFGKWPNK